MRIEKFVLAASVVFATQAHAQPAENPAQSDLGLIGSQGFTAEALLQQDVSGQDGEPIGEVINFEIGDDHEIRRLLINSDGFLGLDETVIAVPFDAVDLTAGEAGIRASIEEDDTDAYSIFGPQGNDPTSASSFRVSSLIGDNVLLDGGEEFGYLADLAFDREGRLEAVIVRPDVGFDADGHYAFAFEPGAVAGQAFDPSATDYRLPLDRNAVLEEDGFDYEAYQDQSILSAPATEGASKEPS